jgi:hypothetical protein
MLTLTLKIKLDAGLNNHQARIELVDAIERLRGEVGRSQGMSGNVQGRDGRVLGVWEIRQQ